MHHQFPEVEELRDHARPVNGHRFLRVTGVAFGAVNELTARAVGEFDLRGHTVRERQPAGGRPGRLRQDTQWPRVEEEAKIVQKMTRLAEHATAAFGVVPIPVLRIEPYG